MPYLASSPVTTFKAPSAIAGELLDRDPMACAVRMASGRPTDADIKLWSKATRTWIESSGEIPLERCMHLATTQNVFRMMQRDRWICEAAKQIPKTSAWTVSDRLADEWDEFITRGPWRLWRDDSDPPADASPLSRCLFYASRYHRGNALSAKQIGRKIGHIFR